MTAERHRIAKPTVTRELAGLGVWGAAWLVGLAAEFWAVMFLIVGAHKLWQEAVAAPLDGQPIAWGQVVAAALSAMIGAAGLWTGVLLLFRWGPRLARKVAGGPLSRSAGAGGGGFGGGGFFGGGGDGGGGGGGGGGDGGGC